MHFVAAPFDCNEIFTDRGVKKHGEPKLPVLAITLTDLLGKKSSATATQRYETQTQQAQQSAGRLRHRVNADA
jgi:hypothetical protein